MDGDLWLRGDGEDERKGREGGGGGGGERRREDEPMIIVFKFVVHSHLVFHGNVFEDKRVVVDLFEAVVRGAETHCSFELVTGFVVVAGFEGGGGSAVGGVRVDGNLVEGSRDASLSIGKGAGEDDGGKADDGSENPEQEKVCEHDWMEMGEIIEKGECGGMIEEGGVKDVSAKRKRHEPVRLYKAKIDRSKKGGVYTRSTLAQDC